MLISQPRAGFPSASWPPTTRPARTNLPGMLLRLVRRHLRLPLEATGQLRSFCGARHEDPQLNLFQSHRNIDTSARVGTLTARVLTLALTQPSRKETPMNQLAATARPVFESGVETMFDDLVRRAFGPATSASFTPPADIYLDGEDVTILLEAPGLKAGDLEIEIKDRLLVISGTRPASTDSQEDTISFMRREIRRGDFSRTFRLPSHIKAENIQANYEDGMLRVLIKQARPTPVSQLVEISGLNQQP